jgi:uncharacterized integral membrane protein (TIGR00698 family)
MPVNVGLPPVGTHKFQGSRRLARLFFWVLLAFVLTPWASPPTALALGLLLALTLGNPYEDHTRGWSQYLLQTSVVALGFGMNLQQVLRTGREGFFYTSLGIAVALLAGFVLGKILAVRQTASFLISVGTAICGGSAIAAVAPVIGANDEEISVSLGTVFILNAVGLFLFPWFGHSLNLTQSQFGMWAALAIHDTSSVVGAAAKYGPLALVTATTVKLTRALWIIPIALAAAFIKRGKATVRVPWFIFGFVVAAIVKSYAPTGLRSSLQLLNQLGKIGLAATLFLIGVGISRTTIAKVGARPLLQGIILWALVAIASLLLIRYGIAVA